MDEYQKSLLEQVAGLHEVPAGAYNIRANGQAAGRQSTEHIEIVTKEDKQGIDIYIKPGTKKESVMLPLWQGAAFIIAEAKQASTAVFIRSLLVKMQK